MQQYNDLRRGTRRDKDNLRTGGIAMRRSGFTTIEMVIVVVLIGIIAMIGFPKISKTLDKTNVRSARDSVQYDPRGLSMDAFPSNTVARLTGSVTTNQDSVMINPLGKVVRQ